MTHFPDVKVPGFMLNQDEAEAMLEIAESFMDEYDGEGDTEDVAEYIKQLRANLSVHYRATLAITEGGDLVVEVTPQH